MPFQYQKKLNTNYSNLFVETENILKNTMSDLNELYQKLSDKLEYIDKRLLSGDSIKHYNKNEFFSEDRLMNNFNSIKSVIKSNNVLSETIGKIKEFIYKNGGDKQQQALIE